MVFHCFFEQSGTFKNAFKKLGFQSFDYDILNDFNETDFIIDLFTEINNAYCGNSSIFYNINKDDYILAFFPCVRFSCQAVMLLNCTARQLQSLTDFEKLDKSIAYHKELSFLYDKICKLCSICIKRNLKLIIENPYSKEHYLTKYFPLKPKFIDFDRSIRGDNFKKPTQYWFINFEPSLNFVSEPVILSNIKLVLSCNQVDRSIINSNYAERFIKEFIL